MKQLKYALVMLLVMVTGSLYGQTLEELVSTFNKGADEINKGDYMSAITDLNKVLTMAESVPVKKPVTWRKGQTADSVALLSGGHFLYQAERL